MTAGFFSNPRQMLGKMRFLEFNPMAEITEPVHVIRTLGDYDLIIGQDLLHKLGVDISFSTQETNNL